MSNQFPDCGAALNLYPIVDNHKWLEPLYDAGVTCIQLRVKDMEPNALEKEIEYAIRLAHKYNARLFINDYWQLAIKHEAYGVHLGQEDLALADVDGLLHAGLRLGISTHSLSEITNAMSFKPSYLAFGPIYTTTSKSLPFAPQGIEKLAYWSQRLPYPLIAIGGIDLERLPSILKTGVNGVAVISAITKAQDPIIITKAMLHVINSYREQHEK